MHFEFFKQKHKSKISVGDEIAVFSDRDDYISSGRYKVASLGVDEDGYIQAMLVGMHHVEGHICQVPLNAHEKG